MTEVLVEDANNPYGVHPSAWRWNPRTDGEAFSRFLEDDALPQSAREYLRSFTPRILGQCYPPAEEGSSTGLVIGKVQSGKTNSFLALASLASDNNYRLIIVLSGTKNILKDQTYRQVVHRLSRGQRGWKAVDFDPAVDPADFENRLRSAFSTWAPRTLVVTILKRTRSASSARPNPQGIDRLVHFIANSEYRQQLANQPVLIIDDEADEASLDNSANARRRGRSPSPSATHVAIQNLRGLFPRHAFIQYTATPQANLLVELSNELSPDFCELLEPGIGYCGASEFFAPNSPHYREVPGADIAIVGTNGGSPPPSLVDALHYFYIAAAFEEYTGNELNPEIRSMLVHPDRSVQSHGVALIWVQQIHGALLDFLESAQNDPDGPIARALEQLVESVLNEVRRTVPEIVITARDLFPALQARVDGTEIRLINSQRQATEDVDWGEENCWIFVGGDVLQRGFAIRGLTTTWTSRAAGAGQVDVLMQRGRWFGYRASHLQYCRVWMPQDLLDNYYALFADHEEALWRSLRAHLATGRTMMDWSRVFWLDPNPALQLCRRSTQWFRLREQPEWAAQAWVPREGSDEVADAAENSRLIVNLLDKVDDWSHAWRPQNPDQYPDRDHDIAGLPLRVVRDLFEEYSFFGPDLVNGTVIRDAIELLIQQDEDAQALIINMRPRSSKFNRGISSNAPMITQLFTGYSKERDVISPRYYPGDREFHAGGEGVLNWPDSVITLQIYQPRLMAGSPKMEVTGVGGYLSAGCPLVAVHLPESVQHYRRESVGDRG